MDGQADEDGSGAGLTVVAAVLALSAVVVLARRRH
jgi:PGF-CTERM protein